MRRLYLHGCLSDMCRLPSLPMKNNLSMLGTQTREIVDERDDVAETKTCSICGTVFKSWGHNAAPVTHGRCCDECNATVVLPKRIPPTPQRTLKQLRSAGLSLGIPPYELTDERLEQRIAARREWMAECLLPLALKHGWYKPTN